MTDENFPAPAGAATARSLRRRRDRARVRASRPARGAALLVTGTLAIGALGNAASDEAPRPPLRALQAWVSPVAGEAGAARPEVTEVAAAAAASQPASQPADRGAESGPAYRVVAADGGVFTHGWYGFSGSAAGLTSSPVTGVAQTPDGDGYWLASADGGVFSFGSAAFFGSAPGLSSTPVVDIAATPTGRGYWLVTGAGGVFTFGDARFSGAAIGIPLNKPVTSLAPTPTGNGYWLVTSDGGVFSFGDAAYFGSMADRPLNAGVLDLVPTGTGRGYYLLSTDGGVFAFGDAAFHGSAAGRPLNQPIVDMSVSPAGDGYWLVAADGGVFTFGNAPFLGTPTALSAPVVGIVAGTGTQKPPPAAEVVAAAQPAPAAPAPAPAPAKQLAGAAYGDADGKIGWDISYPQCGGAYPAGEYAYAIIGINGGRAFRHNPCLADEWRWATSRSAAGVYVNVNFPRTNDELARGASSVRQPVCDGHISCIAYNFGWNGIFDSLTYARSQGVTAPFVWLDVEALNYWTPHGPLNAVVLRGAIDAVREHGLGVGVYSTPYQYNRITGGEVTGVPVWTAGAAGWDNAWRYCNERAFGGGRVAFVQLLPGQFDPNLACPGAGPLSTYFTMP